MRNASKAIACATIGATALALAAAAIAQESALPAARSVGGVKLVSGGFGKPESEAMLKEASRYRLNLVFSAGKDNEYLGNVQVTVKNEAGKTVLETTSDGPIMLVDLPAGKYSLAAGFRGKTVRQSVEVAPKRATRLDFHWKEVD